MIWPTDFALWAQQWRGPMLRFARLHLQPDEEAEDAVQDALAAALGVSAEQLQRLHQGDPKRYLFGILKNKITDRLRHKYRPEVGYIEAFGADLDELDDVLFNRRDLWVDGMAPPRWRSPESALESEQFFAVVDLCVNKLPAKPARVFSMKELLECEANEICATLGLSQADYWQCMSRARKQIQLCLTQHWFTGERR